MGRRTESMGENKEDRLWAIVHAIEDKTKKDDLHNLSKDELCRLVEKIYDIAYGTSN